MKFILISLLILNLGVDKVWSYPVRKLYLQDSSIGVIRVSPGYSTLIELPQKPKKVIVGNQNHFQVEFTGNRVAIKPLSNIGKTNLFILTNDDRFNFTLIITEPARVDYVVKVIRKSSQSTKSIEIRKRYKNLELKLLKIKKGPSYYKIYFSIYDHGKKHFIIDAPKTALKYNSKNTFIDKLYLSDDSIGPGQTISGYIAIKKKYLKNINHEESKISLIFSLNTEEKISISFSTEFLK